jgi:hypothetical protein
MPGLVAIPWSTFSVKALSGSIFSVVGDLLVEKGRTSSPFDAQLFKLVNTSSAINHLTPLPLSDGSSKVTLQYSEKLLMDWH